MGMLGVLDQALMQVVSVTVVEVLFLCSLLIACEEMLYFFFVVVS